MRTFPLAWPCAAILTSIIVARDQRQPDSLQQARGSGAAGQYQSAGTVRSNPICKPGRTIPRRASCLARRCWLPSDRFPPKTVAQGRSELGLPRADMAWPLLAQSLLNGGVRRLLREDRYPSSPTAGDAPYCRRIWGEFRWESGSGAGRTQQFARHSSLRQHARRIWYGAARCGVSFRPR